MVTKGLAPSLETYSRKYKHIKFNRRNGILEVCLHTDGRNLKWSPLVHEELGYCFGDVGEDPENKVVIITGAGTSFCDELDLEAFDISSRKWAAIYHEGKRLINNLLNIDVPVIGAVNGPAHIHAELLLLSNIVIATPETTLQDAAHFTGAFVPGDGVHVYWPTLLGPTRASYFLLTGQKIAAQEALNLGLVNEVVPQKDLMSRAWALAEQIAQQPPLVRRYTRNLFSQEMKRLMHDHLSHGLALEGLAFVDNTPASELP